jgi:S-formylglutathione hydrolase FrmB
VSRLLDAPLIAGVLPTTIEVAGALGAVYLIYLTFRRGRRWWTRAVPASAAAGVGTALLAELVVVVARPFPDSLPLRTLVWIAVGVMAIGLAAAALRPPWHRRVLAVLAVLLVVTTSTVKINALYGYRPTLAAAFGLPGGNEIGFASLAHTEPAVTAPPGRSLETAWRPPQDMPGSGRIAEVAIPGPASGFSARSAWLYLPPAYLSQERRAVLPVIVLIAGQPGGPQDWLLAGRLAEVVDRFAALHHGLAPVVVVPDATGSSYANPMCLDSRLGNTETYLAQDVPAWIAANLQVDTHDSAVGGFSFGGTCALQLAARRPEVFPNFVDISGQAEPTLGDHAQSVRAAFGGDEEAWRRSNPLDVLRERRFPGSNGFMVVGRDDPDYRPQAERVAGAALAAGMTVQLTELPGGHSWTTAADGLGRALSWFSGRTGLTDPP